MTKIIYVIVIGLSLTIGIIFLIYQFKELNKKTLINKRIAITDSIAQINKEIDSLTIEYNFKPLGFENLIKNLYTTYEITLTENVLLEILNKYETKQLQWIDSFYQNHSSKRLTPERLSYIKKRYLGINTEKYNSIHLKNDIDSKSSALSRLKIGKTETEKKINDKFSIINYTLISCIVWLLIILPVALLIKYYKNMPSRQQCIGANSGLTEE